MVVLRLVEGGVASKTNQIRAGDIISHIEGLPTVGWPLEKVKASMQGPEGTSVKIGASVIILLLFFQKQNLNKYIVMM
jgi:C-terminal processing protease CtpA/Prc